MTKAQERAVERLRRDAKKDLFIGDGEFKEFTVKETDYGKIVVFVEVGGVGDEGTLAAVFCRFRCLFFVGERGGITYYKTTRCKNGKYLTSTKVYKGLMFTACLDYEGRDRKGATA